MYRHAIKNIHEKCAVEVTKEKIKTRCKTFDKLYDIVSKILSQSGFGWDWEKNVLQMDSDEVWDRYVEVNDKQSDMYHYFLTCQCNSCLYLLAG